MLLTGGTLVTVGIVCNVGGETVVGGKGLDGTCCLFCDDVGVGSVRKNASSVRRLSGGLAGGAVGKHGIFSTDTSLESGAFDWVRFSEID